MMFANFLFLKFKLNGSFLQLGYNMLDSGIIIFLSGERACCPLQENDATFTKSNFANILDRIFEKNAFLLTTFALLAME